MRDEHAGVNAKFDAIFSEGLRNKWVEMIHDWEKDKSNPDPFTYTEKGRNAYISHIL